MDTSAVLHKIGARSGIYFARFYEKLPDRFRTLDMLRVAKELDISEGSVYHWLRKMRENGLVVRIRHSEYQKVKLD